MNLKHYPKWISDLIAEYYRIRYNKKTKRWFNIDTGKFVKDPVKSGKYV